MVHCGRHITKPQQNTMCTCTENTKFRPPLLKLLNIKLYLKRKSPLQVHIVFNGEHMYFGGEWEGAEQSTCFHNNFSIICVDGLWTERCWESHLTCSTVLKTDRLRQVHWPSGAVFLPSTTSKCKERSQQFPLSLFPPYKCPLLLKCLSNIFS